MHIFIHSLSKYLSTNYVQGTVEFSLQSKKKAGGAPGGRSRLSLRLQPGHDLADREFKPASGSGLMAQSLELVSDSVSPSLSAPPPFMLCLSLSQK